MTTPEVPQYIKQLHRRLKAAREDTVRKIVDEMGHTKQNVFTANALVEGYLDSISIKFDERLEAMQVETTNTIRANERKKVDDIAASTAELQKAIGEADRQYKDECAKLKKQRDDVVSGLSKRIKNLSADIEQKYHAMNMDELNRYNKEGEEVMRRGTEELVRGLDLAVKVITEKMKKEREGTNGS